MNNLGQVKLITQSKTIELYDTECHELARFHFQEETRTSMMAWLIGKCHELQVKSNLVIVDNRNTQMNIPLDTMAVDDDWFNIHSILVLNNPKTTGDKKISMLSALGRNLRR